MTAPANGFDVYSEALEEDSQLWQAGAEQLASAAARLAGLGLSGTDVAPYAESIGIVDKYEALREAAQARAVRAAADFHQVAAALIRVAREYEATDEQHRRRFKKVEGSL
ncbi:MAG TPA: hypothetical protein VFC19_15450 [Candidatus Limnocylindrales bacterium]|nr:hypothetical protein [Candidatus Limnocylindrales bacterium]